MARFCRFHDGTDLVRTADVARVEPKAVYTGFNGKQGQAVIEVYVRNDRNRAPGRNLLHGQGCFLIRDSAADNITAQVRQTPDLRQRRPGILGLCVRHRLDRNGGIPTDFYGSNLDLTGFSAFHVKSSFIVPVVGQPSKRLLFIIAQFHRSRSESAGKIHVGCQNRHSQNHENTHFLDVEHSFLSQPVACHGLAEKNEEMPAVQRRQRQQVDDGQIQA
jgi:hypothetical protein